MDPALEARVLNSCAKEIENIADLVSGRGDVDSFDFGSNSLFRYSKGSCFQSKKMSRC